MTRVATSSLVLVEKLAAIRKAVWSDVEHAHDLRKVEPELAFTQIERCVHALQIVPLALGLARLGLA